MADKKITTQIKNEIINMVKYILPKNIVNDIRKLLSPCCKPLLEGSEDYSCCDGIATCAVVTVTDSHLKNKTVTLLFEFTGNTNDNHTFSTTAEFDGNGEWSDAVRIWGYVEDGEVQIRVGVLESGSQVVYYSDFITLINVPNCD